MGVLVDQLYFRGGNPAREEYLRTSQEEPSWMCCIGRVLDWTGSGYPLPPGRWDEVGSRSDAKGPRSNLERAFIHSLVVS